MTAVPPAPAVATTFVTLAASTPVPARAKWNGCSSASLLSMNISAVLAPRPTGAKCTTKLVFAPAATLAAGAVTTVNADASVPVKLILPRVSMAEPVFVITKVLLVPDDPWLPKSVKFDGVAGVLPFSIHTLFPAMLMLGKVPAQDPVSVSESSTQFEVVPVSAKLFNVPALEMQSSA